MLPRFRRGAVCSNLRALEHSIKQFYSHAHTVEPKKHPAATFSPEDWKPALVPRAKDALRQNLTTSDLRFQNCEALMTTILNARASDSKDKLFWERVVLCVENFASSLSGGECLFFLTQLSPMLMEQQHRCGLMSRVRLTLLNRLAQENVLTSLKNNQLIRGLSVPVIYKTKPSILPLRMLDLLNTRFKELSLTDIITGFRSVALSGDSVLLTSPFSARAIEACLHRASSISNDEFCVILKYCIPLAAHFGDQCCRAIEYELLRLLDSLSLPVAVQLISQYSKTPLSCSFLPHAFERLATYSCRQTPQLTSTSVSSLCCALARLWKRRQVSAQQPMVVLNDSSAMESNSTTQKPGSAPCSRHVNRDTPQTSTFVSTDAAELTFPDCYERSSKAFTRPTTFALIKKSKRSRSTPHHFSTESLTLAGIERSRYVIPGTERLLQFFRWTLTTLLGHHGANLPIAEVLEIFSSVEDTLLDIFKTINCVKQELHISLDDPLLDELTSLTGNLSCSLERYYLPKTTYQERAAWIVRYQHSTTLSAVLKKAFFEDALLKDALQSPALLSDEHFLRLFDAFLYQRDLNGIALLLRSSVPTATSLKSQESKRGSCNLKLRLGDVLRQWWCRTSLSEDHTILLPFDAVVSTILSFAQGQQTFGSTAASQLRFQIKEVLDAPQSVELEDLIVSCLKHPHAAGSLQWLWEIQRRVDQFMQDQDKHSGSSYAVESFFGLPLLVLSVVSVVARNVQRFTHSTRFSPSYTNGYSFVGFSEVKKEPAATKSESAQPFELETPYEVQQRQTTPLAKANVSGRASSIEALKPSCALAKWFTTLYTFCLLPTHHALLSDTFIFDTLYQLPPKKNVPQNATKPQPMTNTTNVLKPSPSYVWDSWEKNISPGVLANLLLSVLNLAPHLALFRDSDDATSHCLNALSANPALAETLVPLPPLPLHELLLPDLPEPKSPTAETSDLSYAPEKIARKTDNTVSSALSKTKQREHHLPKNASPIAQLDAGNFLDRIKSLHSPPLTLLALTMHRLLLIISDVLLLSCPVPIKRVLNSFLQERFERHNITDVPILSVTRQRTEGKDLFIAIQTYEALRLPHDPLLLNYGRSFKVSNASSQRVRRHVFVCRSLCLLSHELTTAEELLYLLRVLKPEYVENPTIRHTLGRTIQRHERLIFSTGVAQELQKRMKQLRIERLDDTLITCSEGYDDEEQTMM